MKKVGSKNVRLKLDSLAAFHDAGVPTGLTKDRKSYVTARSDARIQGGLAGDKFERAHNGPVNAERVGVGREAKQRAAEFLNRASKVTKISPSVKKPVKPLAPMARVLPFIKKGAVIDVIAFMDELDKIAEELVGGQADGRPDSDFAPESLRTGMKVEREHSTNKKVQKEIAKDHLVEDRRYYVKLKRMEKTAVLRDLKAQAGQAVANMVEGAKKVPGHVVAGLKGLPGASVEFAKNLPGHVVGGAENVGKGLGAFFTPREHLRQGWDLTAHQTKNMGLPMKALMAYGLYTGARDVAAKEDPQGLGRSRLRRGLRFAGEQAGSVMTAPYGFWGGTAGMMVGGKAGDMVGAALDKLRRKRPQYTMAPKYDYVPPPQMQYPHPHAGNETAGY